MAADTRGPPHRAGRGRAELVKACFIPHHRVVVTDQRHQPFEFTVCFACGQASIEGMGVFATPYLWRNPLRRLFSSHGIRLRTDRAYNEAVWPRARLD